MEKADFLGSEQKKSKGALDRQKEQSWKDKERINGKGCGTTECVHLRLFFVTTEH